MLRLARDAYRYLAFRRGHFRGIYENFRQAEAAVPRGGKLGYNHADLAREYDAKVNLGLEASDYPVLFHLDRILRDDMTVLDFGGNIGVHFLRYRKHLNLERVRWVVCDVPEIAKVGRERCADIPNIAFVTDIVELQETQVDVFHASGSLQYLDEPTPDLLLKKLIGKGLRPGHILIDQVPLYDGPSFVTLQNGGLVYYPQHVFNRAAYINAITNFSYELVDAWIVKLESCIVPFHPNRAVHAYSGLYFSESRTS